MQISHAISADPGMICSLPNAGREHLSYGECIEYIQGKLGVLKGNLKRGINILCIHFEKAKNPLPSPVVEWNYSSLIPSSHSLLPITPWIQAKLKDIARET